MHLGLHAIVLFLSLQLLAKSKAHTTGDMADMYLDTACMRRPEGYGSGADKSTKAALPRGASRGQRTPRSEVVVWNAALIGCTPPDMPIT